MWCSCCPSLTQPGEAGPLFGNVRSPLFGAVGAALGEGDAVPAGLLGDVERGVGHGDDVDREVEVSGIPAMPIETEMFAPCTSDRPSIRARSDLRP